MVSGNIFENCSDSCGWVAAGIAALTYGSFGVPIKATANIDVHPLVMQSYKTIMMFAMSWLVFFMGVEIAWTKWGLLSGLLWVVGGTGGIYGIRNAGLAIAVGTWASIMIIVNFIVGILIFREPVYDIFGTAASFVLLVIGLIGMSYYSSPQKNASPTTTTAADTTDTTETSIENRIENDASATAPELSIGNVNGHDTSNANDLERPLNPEEYALIGGPDTPRQHWVAKWPVLTKRQYGLLGAVMNGIFTGCSLVPLHYAKQEGFGGAKFMISFATGALIANTLLFFGLVLVNMTFYRKWPSTMQEMSLAIPPWHLKELLFPGCAAGVLLTIAMFTSILAVTYLGQGVGNSLVQAKILIGGLWGILWYKEITEPATVAKWFLAASTAVAAIIWLSLERLFATSIGGGGGHQ